MTHRELLVLACTGKERPWPLLPYCLRDPPSVPSEGREQAAAAYSIQSRRIECVETNRICTTWCLDTGVGFLHASYSPLLLYLRFLFLFWCVCINVVLPASPYLCVCVCVCVCLSAIQNLTNPQQIITKLQLKEFYRNLSTCSMKNYKCARLQVLTAVMIKLSLL